MYVLIFKKNLYKIFKNTYIWFEKYDTSMGMNDNERMLMDKKGQMDGIGWMNIDEHWIEANEH